MIGYLLLALLFAGIFAVLTAATHQRGDSPWIAIGVVAGCVAATGVLVTIISVATFLIEKGI